MERFFSACSTTPQAQHFSEAYNICNFNEKCFVCVPHIKIKCQCISLTRSALIVQLQHLADTMSVSEYVYEMRTTCNAFPRTLL